MARLGRTITSSAEYTRPANATPYAALDVIADSETVPTVLSFTGIGGGTRAGGFITKARLVTDQKTNTSAYRLHLFNVSPTAINDNALFTLLYATRASKAGHVDFAAAATEDATGSTAAQSSNLTVELAFTSTTGDLFGILETIGGFTPASAQKFYVELTADI